jgi:hypothetical protein
MSISKEHQHHQDRFPVQTAPPKPDLLSLVLVLEGTQPPRAKTNPLTGPSKDRIHTQRQETIAKRKAIALRVRIVSAEYTIAHQAKRAL